MRSFSILMILFFITKIVNGQNSQMKVRVESDQGERLDSVLVEVISYNIQSTYTDKNGEALFLKTPKIFRIKASKTGYAGVETKEISEPILYPLEMRKKPSDPMIIISGQVKTKARNKENQRSIPGAEVKYYLRSETGSTITDEFGFFNFEIKKSVFENNKGGIINFGYRKKGLFKTTNSTKEIRIRDIHLEYVKVELFVSKIEELPTITNKQCNVTNELIRDGVVIINNRKNYLIDKSPGAYADNVALGDGCYLFFSERNKRSNHSTRMVKLGITTLEGVEEERIINRDTIISIPRSIIKLKTGEFLTYESNRKSDKHDIILINAITEIETRYSLRFTKRSEINLIHGTIDRLSNSIILIGYVEQQATIITYNLHTKKTNICPCNAKKDNIALKDVTIAESKVYLCGYIEEKGKITPVLFSLSPFQNQQELKIVDHGLDSATFESIIYNQEQGKIILLGNKKEGSIYNPFLVEFNSSNKMNHLVEYPSFLNEKGKVLLMTKKGNYLIVGNSNSIGIRGNIFIGLITPEGIKLFDGDGLKRGIGSKGIDLVHDATITENNTIVIAGETNSKVKDKKRIKGKKVVPWIAEILFKQKKN